jgi:Protein of unknown function (DUF3341)
MSLRSPCGLLAEFTSAEQLLTAVARVRAASADTAMEVYSPYPIKGLGELLDIPANRVPLAMLLGAVLGGVGTYAVEWYAAVINYPLNIGGRPLNSWPAFLPPALEMTILGAVLLGVLALLVGSGLPRLNHPLFGVPEFERASSDHFFLMLPVSGGAAEGARALLQALAPLSIIELGE